MDKNKALGAMVGVAVGDALGATVEFMSPEQIKKKHGTHREMIGGGWLRLAPGEITDDTEMTMMVAEGIVQDPNDPVPLIGEYFIKWLHDGPKDVGGACSAAISRAAKTKATTQEHWLEVSEKADKASRGQTAGNGALMRTVFPALYYPEPWAHRPAAVIGRMTHWHDHSTKAVICYTNAVAAAVRASGPDLAKHHVETKMQIIRKHEERLGGQLPPPNGYVLNSALCAMNAIRETNNFEDAIVHAVNLGGDADTIGAITGGLAGAVYGFDAIPTRWVGALEKTLVERIKELAAAAMARQEYYKTI